MKTVLLVDDQRFFLRTVQATLRTLNTNCRIITARNGKQALKVLATEPLDLVITDLKMPVMDGFSLLSEMGEKYPFVPVIIMSAFVFADIEGRINQPGGFRYLKKPVDLNHLSEVVSDILSSNVEGGINGISVSGFLQLIEMEQKTCTLRITSNGRIGYMYVEKGRLYGARFDGRDDLEAALEIVGWESSEIEIFKNCSVPENRINLPMNHVLLEGLRRKDEGRWIE